MFSAFGAVGRVIAGAPAAFIAFGLATAYADPAVIREGAAQLPTSGLVIDLPARDGMTYHVSGSWSFNSAGNSFDTRDVVDEVDIASGNVTAGNWIMVGYFDAGDCDAVLKGEKLDASWAAEEKLWGASWKIRGGIYTFDNALGRRPMAVLCRSNEAGRSLLLYRFLTDQPETLDKPSIMQRIKASIVLEHVSVSYDTERTGDILPLKRPEVRNRGAAGPQRSLTLTKSKLRLDTPDDGYFWLGHDGDQSDMLDRMLPALPDITVEVSVIADEQCGELLANVKTDKPEQKPLNLPAGWIAGPTMLVDKDVEMITCRQAGYGALLVGFLQGERADVRWAQPILEALGRATRVP